MVRSPHLLHSKIFLKRGGQYGSELRHKNRSAGGMPYLTAGLNSILLIRRLNNCDVATQPPQSVLLPPYDVSAVILELIY